MRTLQSKLLRWYDREARDLPWRGSTDPYSVWVSEIMLQQTRVDTVVPYYERFLERFPTLRALAEADEDTVLSHWSGLGYYRRARLLHAGVREVVERYGGKVPEDAEARLALPGVGRYTAGAIGSIAFDRQEPVVDGNVTRVLARLKGIELPVGTTEMNKRLWLEAESLVPNERPGDFNQALMELGATVCTPKQPRCDACPLDADCAAFENDMVEQLPIPKARKAPTHVDLVAVVATSGRGRSRRFWLTKETKPLFGGLWSVPTSDATPADVLARLGLEARIRPEPTAVLDHTLSHRKLHITLYRATGTKGTPSETLRPLNSPAPTDVGKCAGRSSTI